MLRNRTYWRVWRPDRRAASMPVQPPAALLPSAMPPVDTRPRSRRSRMIASVAAGRVLLTIRHERQPHLRGATQGVFRHHLHTRDGACTSLAWVVSCAREAMLEGNNLQQNCKLSASCLQCPSRRLSCSNTRSCSCFKIEGRRQQGSAPHLPGSVGSRDQRWSFTPAQSWTHSALVDAQCDQLLRPTGCTNQVRSWLHWPGTIPPFNPHIQLRLHRPAIIFMGSHCLGLG